MIITAKCADGTEARAVAEGNGPVVLVLPPGLDDGASWAAVAARLAPHHRVVRLHRRRYRLDLDQRQPCTVAQEVAHVLAMVEAVGGGPVLLAGHSSGAVVALEAMVAAPAAFAGAVLYEPPIVIGPPLGGPDGEVHRRARAAIAAGRPGRAMRIFVRDTVGLPGWAALLVGCFVAVVPRMRALAPRQVEDNVAMDALGIRLEAYAGISAPVVLLGGDRSPAHLGERLDALERTLPDARRVLLAGQGHSAHAKAPDRVAAVVAALAAEVSEPG
ncbi:alpha/beta fold hydrolase [Nonomuraea gerenzanensis]|uniref:Alpha/beta hydrolase fold n=1 Tax=Nonomuraea gerenzanensis TaxID=93944 RepID=A0A1M4E068_9ACTN|nr:alpha/beta hydrolase [Nonomuraea gerenzanensis]UBU14493.1 alpha/beta hydrolase [Nonomuraea gerenzanensis]SBO92209.1 alpha/beta hydrolase fold [Nonomuraea gerenzanensis]